GSPSLDPRVAPVPRQRLEPPLSLAVEVQDVVVVGEVPGRHRVWPGRWRGEPLDERARLVAEEPDDATAHRPGTHLVPARRAVETGLVEQVEGVDARPGPGCPPRRVGDHRTAAEPRPAEGD